MDIGPDGPDSRPNKGPQSCKVNNTRTRRSTAASAQSTVRSDQPEQGMIVLVNGLETALNNVASMMANIMERLDQALPGPSGTRNVPTGQPRQVLHTASSPILQELHDPEEIERERQAIARLQAEEMARNNRANGDRTRAVSQVIGNGNGNPRGTVFERISHQRAHRTGRGGSQAPMRSLVVLDEEEVQSQARVPAPQRLGPQVPEAGEFQDLRQQIQEMQRKINRGRVFTTRTNTPLAPEIFAEPYPQGFKMSFVKRYDGESDPQEHINSYVQVMIAVDASDALMCRCFLQTVDSKKVCNVEDTGKWCAYHHENDHNTEDCYTLKNEMARLIRRCHLKKFVQDRDRGNPGNAQSGKRKEGQVAEAREKRHIRLEDEEEDSEPAPHRQKTHHGCNYIIRGNIGGDSAISRKKWASGAMVNKVAAPAQPERKKLKTEPILFSNADLPETGVPHRDALVITIDIIDLLIHKTLVDTRSSVNIMYMDTYKAFGLTRDELLPIKTPLTGFTGDSIEPEGVVTLPVEVGEVTAQLLKAEERLPRVEVASDIEEVDVEPGMLGRLDRIGKGLGAELRSRVISVLRRFRKVFAWSPADMPGLDHKIAVHRLNVSQDAKPVNRRGIEANPEKVRAIMEMEPPKTAKEVQRLTGRLAALNRFLSKLAEKAHPFFTVIKKRATFEWTQECQEAYEELKRYLASPPILSKPEPGDVLTLYLAIADCAISTVIVREENGAQHPVYYVSKTLRDAELSTRWSSGRVHRSKGRHSPTFKLSREMTRARVETRVEDNLWVMSIDGSSGSRSCGAGIVLITPESFRIYYAIKFQFRVSNNEAEYEALINGLKILSKLGVSRVQVYSDSRLVVGQISGEFEAKEERMKKYRDLSLEMLGRFEYKLEHIPRAYNAEADVLSKLSAESPEYISKLATVEELATPSLNRDEVLWVSADPPEWLDRLARYIEDGVAPENPQKSRLLRMRALTYKVWDEALYKRSYNGVLLRCLRAAEAKALIQKGDNPGIFLANNEEGLTTPRRATGDTPFGLAYGFEARATAETVIPTRREMAYDPEVNEQNQAIELNFLEERRDEARVQAENYRRQVKSYFDSRVKPRAFQVGDYILRKREKSQPTKGGKLAKKYEGPYTVKAVVRPGLTSETNRVASEWGLRLFWEQDVPGRPEEAFVLVPSGSMPESGRIPPDICWGRRGWFSPPSRGKVTDCSEAEEGPEGNSGAGAPSEGNAKEEESEEESEIVRSMKTTLLALLAMLRSGCDNESVCLVS
ncbi:unnamed protein product [Cuscuta campestris]|uniref:RNase H type-1 domain-containing protein n=1 Tax=Cuscuta campestris TaxID=132261 RepID=A0A484LTR7_9ASTE|nr:unnamed protein product [Cuscuta campestris]